VNRNEWDIDAWDSGDWDEDNWDEGDAYTGTRYEPGEDLSPVINNGQRVRDLRMLVDMTPGPRADFAMIRVNVLLAIEAGMMHLERPLAQLLADGIGVALSDVWVETSRAA